MDQRLFDAARTGNVVSLHALLKEDPMILDKICLAEFAETPLHVAALSGKTEFAKEIIRIMPFNFVRELNKDGFAPMHMASARGDEKMVMELLKLDEDRSLCLQRDNSGQIPLHYAVARGRIPVIEKLICHCIGSLQEETTVGETILHLAVKNSQFEALKVVLERLKGLECFEMLLNKRDNRGKGTTVAELAEATKQVQVLELLEEYQIEHTENDASAKNPGNDDIMEFAADKQARQHSISMPSDPKTDDKQTDKQESNEKGKKKPSKLELDNLLLVAAVLIATVTYQAVVTPPSSIWEKGINLDTSCIFKISQDKNSSFERKKQHCPAFMYYLFLIFNTAGFLFSVALILVVTLPHDYIPLQLLGMSIALLLMNYGVLIMGLSPDGSIVMVLFIPLGLILSLSFIFIFRKTIRKFGRNRQMARNIPEMKKLIVRVLTEAN